MKKKFFSFLSIALLSLIGQSYAEGFKDGVLSFPDRQAWFTWNSDGSLRSVKCMESDGNYCNVRVKISKDGMNQDSRIECSLNGVPIDIGNVPSFQTVEEYRGVIESRLFQGFPVKN